MAQRFRILVVEDDKNMNFMLKDNLEIAGYEVEASADGQVGLSTFLQKPFDLCVLDVMLPKKDGFQLASEIRKVNLKVPIVFLTAKTLNEDRIKGFKSGADDYITKPFSVEELLLRIEGILKRVYNKPTEADKNFTFQLGTITCNFSDRQLISKDATINITNKESKLLQLFCRNINKVIDRDLIQKAIWEDEGYFVGRSMDVFISRLRKYLSADPDLELINVHGVGYKLALNRSQNDNQSL